MQLAALCKLQPISFELECVIGSFDVNALVRDKGWLDKRPEKS
jgi:hypothetical protein